MLETRSLDGLWFHVILQAFVDLMSSGSEQKHKVNKEIAHNWINLNNKEFILACGFANMDPKVVFKAKCRILRENKKYRIKTHQD